MTYIDNNYIYVHTWLRKTYGKANKCTHPDCLGESSKKYEWALKKGCIYEKRVENFMQMCVSCHRRYDFSDLQRELISKRGKETFTHRNPMKSDVLRKRASEWMKNRVVSEETKKKMSTSKKMYRVSDSTKIKISAATTGGLNPAAKKVYDTKNGHVYGTISEAAKVIGMHRSTLAKILSGKKQNKTTLQYYG